MELVLLTAAAATTCALVTRRVRRPRPWTSPQSEMVAALSRVTRSAPSAATAASGVVGVTEFVPGDENVVSLSDRRRRRRDGAVALHPARGRLA